jgi:glycosyltransferase involved in cell wall biosynthesis
MTTNLQQDDIELSIVMPCLNEAETLGACIQKAQLFLKTHDLHGEIIVGDNGSTDGSIQIAESLGARVISVAHRGYGATCSSASKASLGRHTVLGDRDSSYDFSNLMPFLEKMRGGMELVIGNRFQGGIESEAMPWKNRVIGNPVLTYVGQFLFSKKTGDYHCGLRSYSRSAFDKMALKAAGMEFASEMIARAHLLGLEIDEAPTTLSRHGRSRKSHLRPWRDGCRHLRLMLSIKLASLFQKFFRAFIPLLPTMIGNTNVEPNSPRSSL